MMRLRLRAIIAIIIFQAHFGFGQAADKSESDTVRVTVSMKADGSRTGLGEERDRRVDRGREHQ